MGVEWKGLPSHREKLPRRKRPNGLGLAAALALALTSIPIVSEADSVTPLASSLPSARFGASAVWDGSAVLVFGGSAAEPYDDVLHFDPGTESFSIARARLPAARFSTSAVWDGQRAYIFGGHSGAGPSPLIDEILIYDPVADLVTNSKARLPTPRYGTTAVWTGEAAYIFGGYGCPAVCDDILRYDPRTDTLETTVTTLQIARTGASSVWTGTYVYVLGGYYAFREEQRNLDDVVEYDPQSGQTRNLGPILPTGRYGAAAYWDGAHVWLLGGARSGTTYISEVLKIDPIAGRVVVTKPSLPTPRSDMGVAWQGQYAFLFGGAENPGVFTEGVARHLPVNLPPLPAFTYATRLLSIEVDARSAADVDGRVVAYRWDWGDGGPAGQGAVANHTYPVEGTWLVNLTVTDDEGTQTFLAKNISVSDRNIPPSAAFTYKTSKLTLSVDASSSFDPDGAVKSYTWDWGDGSDRSDGSRAVHSFREPGVYVVTLTVRDGAGESAQVSQEVSVALANQSPRPSFSIWINGLTANVDAAAALDPDGRIVFYNWTWGDSSASTGTPAIHLYGVPGTYEINLIVTDDKGASAEARRTVTLEPPPGEPPVPAFDFAKSGLRLEVDASRSFAPSGSIVRYAWDWGDGSAGSTGVKAEHIYKNGGTFIVALTVGDDAGRVATSAQEVSVSGGSKSPPVSLPTPGIEALWLLLASALVGVLSKRGGGGA